MEYCKVSSSDRSRDPQLQSAINTMSMFYSTMSSMMWDWVRTEVIDIFHIYLYLWMCTVNHADLNRHNRTRWRQRKLETMKIFEFDNGNTMKLTTQTIKFSSRWWFLLVLRMLNRARRFLKSKVGTNHTWVERAPSAIVWSIAISVEHTYR